MSVNVLRHIRRDRSTYSWNRLDLTRNDLSAQAGIIKGLKNIEPPIRLSLLPYVSTYLINYDNETELSFNGGMDLKYGINESFTLDMTLIPDFGQVGFDNQVLNSLLLKYNTMRKDHSLLKEQSFLIKVGCFTQDE